MWIKLPDNNSINMDNVTDFYASGQYDKIVFITNKTQHSVDCYFKSKEDRDKYLNKLNIILDSKNLDETVTL